VTSASEPPITRVTGGVAGLTASYAAMLGLADRYVTAAWALRDCARDDARASADPDLLASAPLSPVTFAEAEAALVDATAGLHGVLEVAAAYEADAFVTRALVGAYRDCDRGVAVSFEVLDHQLGQVVGDAARTAWPSLAVLGLVAAPAWRHAPIDTRRLDGTLEALVEEHPATTQHVVDGAGGLLDGLLGLPPWHRGTPDAAADLARLYPAEGPPTVRRRGDLAVPLGSVPPRSLAGLLRHLRQTSALSLPGRSDAQGTVEVQRLVGHRHGPRYVVYLPGTDDTSLAPWSRHDDVRDVPGDLRSLAQQPTTYAAGIERVMTQAGVGPHDPVLLVGHSLGGMEAASLLAHGSPFHVTHVVTAGAPIADVHGYPAGAHVLSLENRGDVVPLLDGRDNADSLQQVTVQFDDPAKTLVGAHALRHYVHGAAAVDASSDPSVREQLASLRTHGFLRRPGTSGSASSEVFQIVR
jgi:hypothetical protein